jgi:hypothetical protein
MATNNASQSNPAMTLLTAIRGFWVSQAIFTSIQLGLADRLTNGPLTASLLAEQCSASEDALYRLMRGLVSAGIFAELSPRTFANNDASMYLRSDIEGSLASTGFVFGELYFDAWHTLTDCVRSGDTQFESRFGQKFFPYLKSYAELGAHFQAGLANVNARTNRAIPEAYDFSRHARIADIGGGNGSLLASILTANPGSSGVLFDQPQVLEEARSNLKKAGVSGRVQLEGGSFFDAVPSGYDAYVLRWILHDFNDDDCVRILKTCRRAMDTRATLLVLEQIVGAGDQATNWHTCFLDLHMLIVLGGRERSRDEYESLFNRTGFILERVVETPTPVSILEARPN